MKKKVKEYVASLLFPPVCPFCEKVMDENQEPVCGNCLQALVFIREPLCMKCGKGLKEDEEEICSDCAGGGHLFHSGRAMWKYEGIAAESILRFKYHDQRKYAGIYGKWMYRYLGDWIGSLRIDLIIPVPIHKKRLKARGYNQAALLAQSIGSLMKLEVDEASVLRSKNTAPQKNLSAFERMKNMQHAFEVRGENVRNKRILIVDDIYTTGVTTDAVTYALRKAGAQEVFFVALASGGA